ncbi:amidase [Natrarchaeobaculum sulfurireducens]|uniref:Asp-tRNAAsn/Glu-tRNAGln amidotransferase A subunit n=1 Tax=Natrarchaeobaculum sulfurireducens TaxID=2044521 RepID=A0A346PF60_9EURY|nr:amidase [Natrarchaeobaculum sulfurireducens]AXR78155.1 Asp-tRNAAsn/Glu-tRNAGln amidotransferase A subunit [Natrarchaeobaculum sulfurireducens]
MVSVTTLSARELAAAIRSGETSAVTVVDAILERIESADDLNAFITVTDESAREAAREADRAAAGGETLGPLHGVPVAIKDLRDRKSGVRNTLGLAALSDNVAETDSVVVERLEAAGAVIVGTTNTPALGHTIKTDNRLVGATATPFDLERSAGGSSGGSAAAVAAGLASLATGSDIGGSLRVPASCCNVVGLKPTLGRVPSNSRLDAFDTHTPFMVGGPIARTADDIALTLEVLAGVDHRDPYSVPTGDEDFLVALDRPTDQLSIAYSPDLDLLPVDPAVRDTVADAVDDLEAAGATVRDVDVALPDSDELREAYYAQVGSYFAAVAARVESHYGVDLETADVEPTVTSTVALAQGFDGLEERLANGPRTDAYDAIEAAIGDADVLVTPTLTVPPYGKHLRDRYPTEIDGESVDGLPTDAMLTWVFNLTGHPAASVPAGVTDDGLPVGLQVVGRRYAEADVLATTAALERVRPWAHRYPDC